ncbi:MAG TPA: hypothetical protein VGK03_08890 [Geothrix sp.]|jgi:hypothetical protein
MLDLLLLPAALLLTFALRAVRRGDHRLHGHLMVATATVVALRILLHPRTLERPHLILWLLLLGSAGGTLLLGRAALAWREGRSTRSVVPRLHRAAGALTLTLAAFTLVVWFLRNR